MDLKPGGNQNSSCLNVNHFIIGNLDNVNTFDNNTMSEF